MLFFSLEKFLWLTNIKTRDKTHLTYFYPRWYKKKQKHLDKMISDSEIFVYLQKVCIVVHIWIIGLQCGFKYSSVYLSL